MDSTTAHYQTLRDRHHQLEREITAEQKRRAPDSIKLHELKKQKLVIKEQMELSG